MSVGKIRESILFSGRVQGVGFRWHAREIACSLHLTGWVRNCYDGRVEMEVQGRAADIAMMLRMLREERFIWIEEMEVRELPLETESGFRIR